MASNWGSPKALVSRVNGSWMVPVVTSQIVMVSQLLGLADFFDGTLIQAGTKRDVIGGVAVYSVWYELLPFDAVVVDSINVSVGDRVSVLVALTDRSMNTWLIETVDSSNGQSFSRSLVYDSSMLSGEWVVERSLVNNSLGRLADFRSVEFSGCSATLNGTSGPISSLDFADATMVNRQDAELVSVSSLSSEGTRFTVDYLPSQPVCVRTISCSFVVQGIFSPHL